MKKFIAVFDGSHISKSTQAYAEELAYTTNAHLVGLFLDDMAYRNYDLPDAKNSSSNLPVEMCNSPEKRKKKREEAIRKFEDSCRKAKINFSVRSNKGVALLDLKHESMFADLMIISEHESFSRYKQKSPTRFIKELLADVQCPVLVVPGAYKPIDKVTLLYDGGPSSLYAVKMFSYLFGDYNEIPVEVFSVKGTHIDTLRLPDNKLMREFMKRHFPKATYKVVKGNPEEQILGYLRNHKENEMVVLGAYRRSEISRWFKTSMADVLMRELDTPLFIAHHK